MVNEKALTRAMIKKWKSEGYGAGRFDADGEDRIVIFSPSWQLTCKTQNLPRRCLGLIVEHCGELGKESAIRCIKGGEQMMLPDVVKGIHRDLLQLREDAEGCMMRTGITIAGCGYGRMQIPGRFG